MTGFYKTYKKNIKTQVSRSFINKSELKQNATPDHIIAKLEENTERRKL